LRPTCKTAQEFCTTTALVPLSLKSHSGTHCTFLAIFGALFMAFIVP
jgi:hypothetical protein